MSNVEECPRFEGCISPFCPLDKDSLENGIWYSDEEICKNQKVNKLDWVRRQRKLSRKANTDFYFNIQMLKHKFVIRKGIKGLDPDKPKVQEEAGLKKWFSAHPILEKRELTPEYLERLKKGRDLKKSGLTMNILEKKAAHNEDLWG